MDRGEKVEWVRRHLVPRLDREIWEYEENRAPDRLESAEVELAKAYVDEASSVFWGLLKMSVFLLAVDVVLAMPAQVYGLVFDIWGAWILLAYGGLHGRYAIAKQSAESVGLGFHKPWNEAVQKALARDTVVNNVGLVWLTFGFVLQILAVSFLPGGHLIELNFWAVLGDLLSNVL